MKGDRGGKQPPLFIMWYFKLITNDGKNFYYDSNELNEAMKDRIKYGGVIVDRNGKIY